MICLKCACEVFTACYAGIEQEYLGEHFTVTTPVMKCSHCGWVAVAIEQVDELRRQTMLAYERRQAVKLETALAESKWADIHKLAEQHEIWKREREHRCSHALVPPHCTRFKKWTLFHLRFCVCPACKSSGLRSQTLVILTLVIEWTYLPICPRCGGKGYLNRMHPYPH